MTTAATTSCDRKEHKTTALHVVIGIICFSWPRWYLDSSGQPSRGGSSRIVRVYKYMSLGRPWSVTSRYRYGDGDATTVGNPWRRTHIISQRPSLIDFSAKRFFFSEAKTKFARTFVHFLHDTESSRVQTSFIFLISPPHH